MTTLEGRIALVTGASAGIGLNAVQHLLQQGMTVVACARRHQLIVARDNAHADRLYARHCDLAEASQIDSLFDFIKSEPKIGRIDVCILNAGTTSNHSLLDARVEEWKSMLDVNVLAASYCAQLSVKLMLSQGTTGGHIVFINSASGHAVHPHPLTRFYSATKFAVTALVDGWRAEVKALGAAANGLRVSSISPRLVASEFPYLLYPGEPEKAKAILDSVKCLQPEDVSAALLYVLTAPAHVEVQDVHISPTEKKY